MNQIKAFVGHSFNEREKPVISKFLEYFDQLEGLVPHFSWDHAQAAEPKELAEKVLAIISDKNVFIGICTKNEIVADEASYKTPFFSANNRIVAVNALQSKTSDWIIQEIGLAKGRGMEIVLLVEEGVRPPGGLQGNIEYIPFNRNAPEKSFGQIIEMIRSLSPKQASIATSAEPSTTGTGSNEKTNGDDDLLVPKPDWKIENYSRAMFRALVRDDHELFSNINNAFFQSPESESPDAVPKWQGRIEYLRILTRRGGSLDKLKSLVDANPKNANLIANLAGGLAEYDDNLNAAKTYVLAASLPSGADRAFGWRIMAAIQFAKAQNFDDAEMLIEQLKTSASGNKADELRLLDTIRTINELRKRDEEQIAAMERIVEGSPDDSDMRFALAHKHSQISNDDMALYHYLKTPFEVRTAIGWNNLGVMFDRFNLPNKAVDAYRKAKEKGETLAMSNLGYKLMQNGFLAEAEVEFSEARKTNGYHKNVDLGLAELKNIPEEEEKALDEALEKVRHKAEFYKLLGAGIAAPKATFAGAKWQDRECVLDVSVTGDVFRATGTYEIKRGCSLSL